MDAEPTLADCRLRVNGRSIFARVSTHAPAGQPPVVLVHGLGVSGRYLVPTARLLAERHAVYVPDLPGWGKSEKPAHALGVPEAADELAAWMRASRLHGACLLANSLGCQFIVDLALRHPGLADWLVLVGPTMDPAAGTVLGQALRGSRDLLREPARYWPILARDYLAAGPIRTLQTLRHALADPVREKLTRVTLPALVVRGGRDPIAPQSWTEEVAGRLLRGRLGVVPDAAHVVNFTHPAALTRMVEEFLAAEAFRSCPGKGR